MAKIILNVALKSANVDAQLKTLKSGIDSVAQSLKNITVNKDLTAQLNALTKYYNAVASAAQKATTATEKRQLAEQRLATEVARTNTQQAKYAAQVEKLNQVHLKSVNNVDRLQKQYASLLLTMKNASKNYPRGTFTDYTKQVTDNLNAVKALNAQIASQNGNIMPEQQKQLEALSAQFSKLSTEIGTVRAEGKKAETQFGSMVTGFMKWTAAATLVMQSINLIKAGFASLNETLVNTEKRVIAIRRVLNEDISSENISNDLYNLAIEYGQTFDNVADIAENFAKTGMDWTESIQAAEAALLALNVAELDSEDASEGLIAIMVQFGKEASELTDIIDKLNKTADRFPVSTEEILLALEKTGSYAKQAKMSLEETVAVITALSSATNASGQQLGTAIKSLLAYTTRSASLDTYAALSPDMAAVVADYRKGAVSILEVWEGLSKEMQHLTKEQGDMLAQYAESAEGQALEDALGEELGEVYDDMTGVYDTAGTYRKNYFIALMSNFNEVSEALEEMEGALGYSQEENEAALETYEKKLNSLKAQWEKLANDEQGFLAFKKGLIDIGSSILDVVEAAGGLGDALGRIGMLVASIAMGLTGVGLIVAVPEILKIIDNMHWQKVAENISEGAANLEKLSVDLEAVKNQYDSLSESVTKYRDILANSNSTEDERESALESLKKIQDDLIDSNEEYAESLDLINGNLDDQLEKLNQIEIKEIQNTIKEFNEENADAALSANKFLTKRTKTFAFDEGMDLYDQYREGYGTLYDYLNENPALEQFGVRGDGHFNDWWKWFGFAMGTADTLHASLKSLDDEGYTMEEWLKILEQVKTQIESDQSITSDSEREYLLASVQDAINQIIGDEGTYSDAMKFLYGDKESDVFTEWLSKEQRNIVANGTPEQIQALYEEFLESIKEVSEETDKPVEDTVKWENSIEHVSDEYDEIVSKMKELRSESQKALEIEQARQDLLNKANGEVQIARVVNAETGQFELQVNREVSKDVLENAEDAAFEEIYMELESGEATNQSILDILDTWDKAGLPEESIESIKDLILQATGVDLDKPVLKDGVPVYDNGGILKGVGGIKATEKDELVLPPWLTEQILRPIPYAETQAAVERAMMEMIKPIIPPPSVGMVYTYQGGNTTRDSYNNTDNRNFYINGVPIPARTAETHTLLEIVEGMSLV